MRNKIGRLAFYLVVAAVICVTMTGCYSYSTVEPLGGGYDEVTYTVTSISEQDANQITLQYRRPNGDHVMIWRSVFGHVVKDGTAIFIGEMSNHDYRFFAVKGSGPVLDITGEVLRQWAKESGIDFSRALAIAGAQTIGQQSDQVVFDFAFTNQDEWPHVFTLNWNQISEIMDEVKEKGTVHKDRGKRYLAEEFKSEK